MTVVLTLILVAVLAYILLNMTGRKRVASSGNTGTNRVPPRRRPKYGKWVGGGLGWALGGPIGGILGFIFGSMYDGMQSGAYEYKVTQRGDFNVSLMILVAAVMKADGRVMRSELNYVRVFLERQFGAAEAQRNISLLQELLKQDIPLQEVCGQIKAYMDYSSKLQLVHFLFGVSRADGQYHPGEIDIIGLIARYIGLTTQDFASVKAMFVKDTTSAYKILEVDPKATDEEIKKAYRKMAVKYHPDKVAHLGEDVQNAAKEKFQKLNEAYEQVKRERGMN